MNLMCHELDGFVGKNASLRWHFLLQLAYLAYNLLHDIICDMYYHGL